MKFKTIVLVDYENIKAHIQCELMPKHTKFIILGGRLSSLPFEMLHETLRYPHQLKWIKTEGSGHNNLDFHLAYFLGRCHTEYEKSIRLVVLSSDKGFDNLIRFINLEGRHCERVSDINLLKKKKYREEKAKQPIKAALPVKQPVKALKEIVSKAPALPPAAKLSVAEPVVAAATVAVVLPTDTLPDYARRIRTIFARRHGNPKTLSKLKNTIQRLLRFSETDPRTDEIIQLLVQDNYMLVQGQMVTYVSNQRLARQREAVLEGQSDHQASTDELHVPDLPEQELDASELVEDAEPEVPAPLVSEVAEPVAPSTLSPEAEAPVHSPPKEKSRSGQKSAKSKTSPAKPANTAKAPGVAKAVEEKKPASQAKAPNVAKAVEEKKLTGGRVPRQPVLTQAQVDSFVAEQKEVPMPQPSNVASEASVEAAFIEQPAAPKASEPKPVLSLTESAPASNANSDEGSTQEPATPTKKRSARSYRKPRKPATGQ